MGVALLPVCCSFLLVFATYYFLKKRNLAKGGKQIPPIEEILQCPEQVRLNLHMVRTPGISGYSLKILNYLYYTKLGRFVLLPWVLTGSNLNLLANLVIPESPTLSYSPPLPDASSCKATENRSILSSLLSSDSKARFTNTVRDFHNVYRAGRTTPLDVAHVIIDAIKNSNSGEKPLQAITSSNEESVLAMARQSTERWKSCCQLSLLDGIPVSIKEDFNTDLYPCLSGATFVPGFTKFTRKSDVVGRFIEAGAIIIGTTNMPELGTNSIGSSENSVHKQPRNPFNPDFFPGGSSSGCAVSVASGLCPISLGGDGGGSGRVPAAVCGVYTLMVTHSRLQHAGSYSFSTLTPITNSPIDLALATDVLCNGSVPRETERLHSVSLSLECMGSSKLNLSGLTMGVYWDWVEAADKKTVTVFRESVQKLSAMGILVKSIKIPELEELRVAHIISSVGELSALISMDVDKNFDSLGPSALMVAALGHSFSAVETVNAMKQRTRSVAALKAVFKQVDIIITPTVGCQIPRITPEYLGHHGKLDGEAIGFIDMFTFLASFTGAPALTLPIGVLGEDTNLPVGMQLIGPWHQEDKLLQYAHLLDSSGIFPSMKPKVFYKILNN